MTQIEEIWDYIGKYGSITPMQAFTDLHITKLATRVGEAKKMGYNIVGEMVTEKKNGKVTRYKRYRKAGVSA